LFLWYKLNIGREGINDFIIKHMGIQHKTFEKIKNLEELNQDEKKELLEDTQRAGFNPIIHQVRVIFDLIDAINNLEEKTTELSNKIYKLNWVIVIFTLIMIVLTIIIIFK